MRVGYIQFAPLLGELERNRAIVRELLEAAPPADLLVLPELANSGYHFARAEDAAAASESARDGAYTRLLTSFAAERGCTVVSGLCERDGERIYNSAILVGPGGWIGTYRKLHLFSAEKDLFSPGDLGLPVFDLGPVRVGLLVCFDWQFVETWRVLALQGADLICHPSNLVIPDRCQRAVPIHAMLNRVFVVTANRIGSERGLAFTGRSFVADPRGEVLAEAPADAPETRVVEIDPTLARDKTVTPRNDLLGDRRPEWYGPISANPS